MTTRDQLILTGFYNQLYVYQDRLIRLKNSVGYKPKGSDDYWCVKESISFYESSINLIEAEIVLIELKDDIPEPTVFKTDSWDCVTQLTEEIGIGRIVTVNKKWSWLKLRPLWVVEYIQKKPECYS
jgi:hypothetical protein